MRQSLHALHRQVVLDTGAGAWQLLGRDTDGRIVRATWDPGQGWSNLTPIPTN